MDSSENKEFADMTLACEDDQKMETHRVIVASTGPFRIIQSNSHLQSPPPTIPNTESNCCQNYS